MKRKRKCDYLKIGMQADQR